MCLITEGLSQQERDGKRENNPSKPRRIKHPESITPYYGEMFLTLGQLPRNHLSLISVQ